MLHSRLVRSSCRRRSSSEAGGSRTGVQGSDTPARYHRKPATTTDGVIKAVTEFIQKTYPLSLLRWIGKMIVVALFVFYIILSSWGVSQLQESFQLESVIPPESYYTKHNQVRFVTKRNVVRIVLCYRDTSQSHSRRSGMDHTLLPAITPMPALPRKRSPDCASPD